MSDFADALGNCFLCLQPFARATDAVSIESHGLAHDFCRRAKLRDMERAALLAADIAPGELPLGAAE